MDLEKYDKLRKKIIGKDFEGKNKKLDFWLFNLSFLGNIGSIFFASFLVFPALLNAVQANFIGNFFWAQTISLIVTLLLLVSFETIKRLLLKNFSFDFVSNNYVILRGKLIGWFIFSLAIVSLSFYLSLTGARNFASTRIYRTDLIENRFNQERDSIIRYYNSQKETYVADNEKLRSVNADLRETLAKTPDNFRTVRNEYQDIINQNVEIIRENENRIERFNALQEQQISALASQHDEKVLDVRGDDFKNIILFILISTTIEILIILGIFFREYYEYNLYLSGKNKLEKIYVKRDRYRALLTFVFEEGKLSIGDKVISGMKLKDIVRETTTIPNSNKVVEEFMNDMERLGVFIVHGKRRNINVSYSEAIKIVENFDDALRILENLK